MTLPTFDDMWDYEQPQVTEEKFRALLPEAEASGDKDYLAELLTQIARTQGLQRGFDAAQSTLDRVETLLTPGPSRARVRYLLERGRVFNSSGNRDRAQPLFVEAWEMAQPLGEDALAIDAAHMVAIAAPAAEQLEWNLKALAMAETATDERARHWQGSLLNNIGWTYHNARRFDDALGMFQRALTFREAQGKPREIRVAKWCIAKATRSLGHYTEALDMQQALLAEWQQSGDEPDGYIYEEIGECLLALGHEEKSQGYFAQAYALLSQDPWLAKHESERLARLNKLSQA